MTLPPLHGDSRPMEAAVTEVLASRATIRRNSMSAVNPLPVAQAVAAPVGTLPIAPVVAVAAAQPAYVQAPLGGVTQGGDVFNGDYRAIVGTWEVEFLEMPKNGATNFHMHITYSVNNGVVTGNASLGIRSAAAARWARTRRRARTTRASRP